MNKHRSELKTPTFFFDCYYAARLLQSEADLLSHKKGMHMSLDIDTLFDKSKEASFKYPESVTLPGIFDTHTHPRNPDKDNDGRSELVIPMMAEVYEDILGMGNTIQPLTTSALALGQSAVWRQLIPRPRKMRLHVAGLVTESTDIDDVLSGYDQPTGIEAWIAMKMFMRAASNSHGADVDDLSKAIPLIRAMANTDFIYKKGPMPLAVHAERKFALDGKRILFLNRNAESMERDIRRIFREIPKARVIVCHVNSAHAIEVIRELRRQGFDAWGEISPHYTQYTCDDLFEGPGGGTALNIHLFCIPVFGTEEDRVAITQAMLSGEPWWFFGCDGACHIDDPTQPGGVKINNKGFVLGGQTQIPKAVVSYTIELFARAGKLALLPDFISHNARQAYHLPRSTTQITFRHEAWTVPETIERTSPRGKLVARVAMGGQTRQYVPA